MDNVYTYSPPSTNLPLITSVIFLVITISMLIVLVIYLVIWRIPLPATKCETSNQCNVTQVCLSGVCDEKICKSDSDCNGNGICINSYCTTYTCRNSNDCPTNSNLACVTGECIKTGTTCKSNTDCHGLQCINSICSQCISNLDCPTGQGCFNQTCRFPYAGETGTNVINYESPAQDNGNITAPPGYFCFTNNCGTGPSGTNPISCAGDAACPNTCESCVNSICRCTLGQDSEKCRANSDCASGLCSSEKICIPSGGECDHNYQAPGCTGCCPTTSPYCVSGKCSPVSLGAICGATGMPGDLCSNPQSLGVSGPTGITPNGMGFFCVNGTCQNTPGVLNELCTTGSCAFINNTALTCTPVDTPSITLLRCLTT